MLTLHVVDSKFWKDFDGTCVARQHSISERIFPHRIKMMFDDGRPTSTREYASSVQFVSTSANGWNSALGDVIKY